MAKELYSANCQNNRTFTVAMWALGVVAGGQLLAMGWVLMRHQPSVPHLAGVKTGGKSIASADSPSSTVSNFPNGGLPPMPEVFRKQMAATSPVLPSSPPEGRSSSGNTGKVASSRPLNEILAETSRQVHPAHRIADTRVEGMLNSGIKSRASGNMQAALRSFQTAEAALPEHPRILSEIAGTYSQMGLDDKAATYWERVYRLGEARAGAYFDMADMVLKGKQLEQVSRKESLLSIADIAEIRDREITTGERIALRVTIQAKTGSQVKGEDMALLVYFFDLVNGKQFLPSTADTSESYISAPYDWKNGEFEAIEVTYYQPAFTLKQKRELGERVYYGYIVELYYRDELQDVVAAPHKLMGPSPSLPSSQKGSVGGPDSSLFPQ